MALMLRGFIDKGAKSDAGGVMCVSAALFQKTPYKRFCRELGSLLEPWGAPAFHATDFYPGGGRFKRNTPERKERYLRDSKRLPIIIGTNMRAIVSVSFKIDEYEAVAPAAWRARFGSLHRIATQFTLMAVRVWMNKSNVTTPVAYVFEAGDDDEAEVQEALDQFWENPIHRKHLRMATRPIPVQKGQARGLEASDFLAWHWNKFYVDSLTVADQPRAMRKDIAALLQMRPNDVVVHLLSGRALVDALVDQGCTRSVQNIKRVV